MKMKEYGINDKLVIKSDKENLESVVEVVVGLILASIGFLWSFGSAYGTYVCIGILTLMMGRAAIYDWISTNRVLIMEKSGCTVCFYHYKKFYKWDELVIKRWENYHHMWTTYYANQYYEGVFFSRYLVKKPKWMVPMDFIQIRRPMTCFCVNFYPYGIDEGNGDYHNQRKPNSILLAPLGRLPEIYPVNKEIFVNYMKLWNVHIEGLSMDTENIKYVFK